MGKSDELELEGWQAASIVALEVQRQRVVQQAQAQIDKLTEALAQQARMFAEMAGLPADGVYNFEPRGGVWYMRPAEGEEGT